MPSPSFITPRSSAGVRLCAPRLRARPHTDTATLRRRLARACVRSGSVLMTGVLAACASVDFDQPKTASHALQDTEDTYFGKRVAALTPEEPGSSGFYLIIDGIEALAARLLVIARAERSIDAQYYLINDDVTGYLFINELVKAADRGVRVRLLVDDIQTQGYDMGMRVLDAHPNFEVRVFNPFPRGGLRLMNGVTNFKRVNRRMHNKSLTADNQVTVIGGRNIGAEYFGARADVNFGDIDVLCFGPVVGEVSTMFDSFWNDRLAVSTTALVGESEDLEAEQQGLRERIAQAMVDVRSTPYVEALDSTLSEIIAKDGADLTWAQYELVYDPAAKANPSWTGKEESILTPLRAALDSAQEEFVLITPYFVPRRSGLRVFEKLRERDVVVCVMTNSLAANNHAAVHSGYVSARKPLLAMGVELYEVKPYARVAGTERAGNESSRATLHSKAFIVDRSRLFVGSFNWDPRSAHINTEMGIILDSPSLAAFIADGVREALPEMTYRVTVNEWHQTRWTTQEEGTEVVFTKEPETGFWKRFSVGFMRLLPIKGQL